MLSSVFALYRTFFNVYREFCYFVVVLFFLRKCYMVLCTIAMLLKMGWLVESSLIVRVLIVLFLVSLFYSLVMRISLRHV